MPRKREGSVEYRGGCWQAHLWFRLPTKHRKWVKLEGIPADDRETAKAAATYAQEILDQRGYVPTARDLTVNEWMPRWIKLRKKLWASWPNDASNYRIYIEPDLGVLPIKAITRGHGRALVRKLDDHVLAGDLADSTAANVWYTATRMFLDATQSNEPEVAVLEANPFRDIEGPTAKSIEREKQFLYPDEFIKLVSCPMVPLVYARLYTIAVYTQVREAEELALDWMAFDLGHHTVHVHQSADYVRDDGQTAKPTKGRKARRFGIEPELEPLLEAMKREASNQALLFPDPPTVTGEYGLANMLRAHLKLAGNERPELTERVPTRMPIRFHDLRATGITWRLARGDAPILVQQDAGHTSFQTTERYIRLARGIIGQEVFPVLPERLLGAAAKSPRKAQMGHSGATLPGTSWAQQGLNL